MSMSTIIKKLNSVLPKVVLLMENWGIESKDYILVDEFAYIINGYNVTASEVASNHLDLYINAKSVPWEDKGERSVIPPVNSTYFGQYENFMKKTGFGLDLLSAEEGILQIPSINYHLSNKKFIKVMKAFEMTEAFVKQTIMHYSLEDVGKEKIVEWISKLGVIGNAAERKGDKKLVSFCNRKITESNERWEGII
jgi:hypothetical protein